MRFNGASGMAISVKGWKRDELEKASIDFDLGRLRAAIDKIRDVVGEG